ncbi:MAG: PEGA domain-containing protein, partial [Candidatus Micrarchaeota archaeon]
MVLDDFYASLEEGYYSLMDRLENDYHIPVYENFITPIEEQGRPSFPIVLGVIFIILILLGGNIYMLLFANASTTLRVQVLVDGKGISGSSVSLDYQGKKLTGVTNEEGFADFNGLKPGEDVTATASSDKYGEGSVSGKIQKGKIIKITLKSRSGNFLELTVIEESGAPLSGARIEYSSESDSGETYSDDSGIAEIDWEGSRLDILVTKSGYDQYIGSFDPSDLSDTIMLRKAFYGGASPSPTMAPDKARLKVYVYDEDGTPLTAIVKTCLSSTSCNNPRSYTAPGGFVQILDYGVNVQLKIIASASGYETASKTTTLAGESSVRFDLDPVGAANQNQTKHKTTISVFNNESRLPLSSLIYILDSDRQIINATPSQTSSYDFYLVNGSYLAFAEAQAFIPNGVGPFKAGENQSIYLARATAQNSKTIRILTIDYNLSPIKTSISFFDSQSYRIPPFDIETDNNGSVSIPGMAMMKYYAVAESDSGLSGERELDLTTNATTFTIILQLPNGTLRLTVLNNATGDGINSYDVLRSSTTTTLLKSCTTSICDINLLPRVNYSLIINASGYQAGTLVLGSDEILPGNVTEKTVRLNPITAPPQTEIKNISLCPKLSATFGIATVQTSCDTLVMKVDPIFPADAIPLNISMTPAGAFAFVANDPSGTRSPAEITGCFDYSSSPGGLALRYVPYRNNCHDYYQPHGNEIRSAVFRLTLQTLSGDIKKELMLYVWNETDLPAVPAASDGTPLGLLRNVGLRAIDASYIPYKNPYNNLYQFTPASYYGFDTESYSTANLRTGYVLNNRQLQAQNDVLMYSGAYGEITLLDNARYAGAASVFGYTLLTNPRGRFENSKSISFEESAFLNVYSNPIGADVECGGACDGNTPYHIEIDPSTRIVKVSMNGYVDYTKTVNLISGQTTTVNANLVPEANITVISFPSGAIVRLNGVFKGYAPVVIHKLAVGTYTVGVSKTGWITETRPITVTQGGHVDARFNLVAGSPMITDGPDLVSVLRNSAT